jgi:transglutaminase-like putative cysteine protease
MLKIKPELVRYWDLPAATLLLAALIAAGSRLVSTHWTVELPIIQTLVFLGALLGFALGQSRFSARVVSVLALAYGFVLILWQVTSTIKEDLSWAARLSIVAYRLGTIIYQLINNHPLQDSLLFVVIMAILFWLLSVHAGYRIVRYANAWSATVPIGLAMIVIQISDPLVTRRAWYLTAFLFFTIVLAARCAFLLQRTRWERSRTSLPPQLGLDFIRFAIFATLALVILAWTAPVLANALPAAEEAFRPVQRAWLETVDRFSKFFASLTPTVGIASQTYGDNAYLGVGMVLNDRQIFSVRPPVNLPADLRLYWRAKTYDLYEMGTWSSTSSLVYEFNPEGEDLSIPRDGGRWLGVFEFVSAVHMATLFSPPQPIWVSRFGDVEYALNSDGTIDLISFLSTPSVPPGQVYRAQAAVNNATVAELRASGTDYPEWVTQRYLQLPDSITPRTLELAKVITQDQPTPYDKALAITEFLRRNITYVEQLEMNPPGDQDLIDWFLFDYQRGFCNYYATAEVIMLRSIGIPARWSTGYAQGERNEDGLFIVLQNNAHSWPEVYFPGIGWVEFEPTASQPDIARAPGEESENDIAAGIERQYGNNRAEQYEDEWLELHQQRGETDLPAENTAQQNSLNVVYWIAILVLGAALLLLGWRAYLRFGAQEAPILVESAFRRMGLRPPERIRTWSRRAALPPMAKAYLEINAALARLGQKADEADTPSERAAHLSEILPPVQQPAFRLVSEYQIEIFSKPGDDPANLADAQQAASEIRTFSWKATWKRWFSRLQQPNQPERRTW